MRALRFAPGGAAVLCAAFVGCGIFDWDRDSSQGEPPALSFTIGPGAKCGPEVIVRTDSAYGCPYELRATASWRETTFRVDIEGVRERPDWRCPAFDIPARLTWSTCFTPPGEAYRIVFGCAGRSAQFAVTTAGGTLNVEHVSGDQSIEYVPWSEWESGL